MTDNINHPPHYTQHPSGIECIDITRYLPFSLGNAVKYCWRADLKNGREDLEKALWYLKDLSFTHLLMVYFNPVKKQLEEDLWVLQDVQDYDTPLGLVLLAVDSAARNEIGQAFNYVGQAQRKIEKILSQGHAEKRVPLIYEEQI